MFIPLERVAAIAWDKALGQRLKTLRGKVARADLSEKLATSGHQCSRQYIQKLETGDALSVSKDLLVAICEQLGGDIGQVVTPTIRLENSKKVTTEG